MKTIPAIIESPKGSMLKYDYDKEHRLFKLSKILPAGMAFPYDFGFIPHTLGEDGDPLDVIVISEFKTFTGCLMDCRIVGGITASQKEKDGEKMRNDRFIAIPDISVMYSDIEKIGQLKKKGIIEELEAFFVNYNKAAGKQFRPLEIIDAHDACRLIASQSDNGDAVFNNK